MKAPTREREKNHKLISEIGKSYKNMLDVQRRDDSQALEGTGSLLFDNLNKKIYVNISVRADAALLESFVKSYNQHVPE